jgi:protein LTV1
MGKGKKKFNSKEAEHFYLLHRSQTDAAHQQEQRPSNFVLVKAADAPQNKSRTLLSNRFSAPPVLDKKEALRLQGGGVVDAESYFSDKVASASAGVGAGVGVGAKGNHVTALGFKNDGYDYSQHLKVMGGGMFVGADGKRYCTALCRSLSLAMT